MYALIEPFIKILLFRAGPQDVPSLQSVFKITLLGCFLTDVLGAAKTIGPSLAILLSAGQIALLGGFIYLLLSIHKKSERWLQTLTAVFGVLALINLASFPFIQNLQVYQETQLVLTPGILLVGALQLWFFITMARIIRDALEIRMGRAALLTFLIIMLVPIILTSIVGALGIDLSTLNEIKPEPL